MLIFGIGILVPMVLSSPRLFSSWNGFTPKIPWNGLSNYIRIFEDPHVRGAWWFTVEFPPLEHDHPECLCPAIGRRLGRKAEGQQDIQDGVFHALPHQLHRRRLHLAPDVLRRPPDARRELGPRAQRETLREPNTVLSGFLIANNWQWIGYWIDYLAALQSVPNELYAKAARVDGASRSRQFFRITIPMLAPAFTICIVGISIGSSRSRSPRRPRPAEGRFRLDLDITDLQHCHSRKGNTDRIGPVR